MHAIEQHGLQRRQVRPMDGEQHVGDRLAVARETRPITRSFMRSMTIRRASE